MRTWSIWRSNHLTANTLVRWTCLRTRIVPSLPIILITLELHQAGRPTMPSPNPQINLESYQINLQRRMKWNTTFWRTPRTCLASAKRKCHRSAGTILHRNWVLDEIPIYSTKNSSKRKQIDWSIPQLSWERWSDWRSKRLKGKLIKASQMCQHSSRTSSAEASRRNWLLRRSPWPRGLSPRCLILWRRRRPEERTTMMRMGTWVWNRTKSYNK